MNNTYETTDFTIASAIISSFNIYPEFLDRSDPSRIRFIFPKLEGLDQLLNAYWKRELKVELNSYASAQKFLKNQIYNR